MSDKPGRIDLRNEAARAIGRLEAEIADLPEGDPKVDDLQSRIESTRGFLAIFEADNPAEAALISIAAKLKQMEADQKAYKKPERKSRNDDGREIWGPTAKELRAN
jgi:hypothetical protein